ncbi:uncharacterized protein [Diadema antillarum]|uniref:uncharacterized protein n=1 Tax=Diadema antillarum TaxID=105358 RepID=UPI003A884B72
MLSTLLLAVCVALVHGITQDETNYFGTTGNPELNTGLTGWITVSESGSNWVIRSNNIPDHETYYYPNNENPNSIEEQSNQYTVPQEPQVASTTTCLPGGPIAIAVNGIVIYNPWDADGENAVEGDGAEVFDMCDGHPDENGRYHYHRQPSSCLFDIESGVPSPMIGVALDGYAIYGPVDENGNTLTSSDLDECHGRYNSDGVYQYHTTADFPYILGCYKGDPSKNVNVGGNNCYKAADADGDGNVVGGGGGGGGQKPPPPHHPRLVRSTPPADARIPQNLFQRRLPTGYQDFLQKVIFRR